MENKPEKPKTEKIKKEPKKEVKKRVYTLESLADGYDDDELDDVINFLISKDPKTPLADNALVMGFLMGMKNVLRETGYGAEFDFKGYQDDFKTGNQSIEDKKDFINRMLDVLNDQDSESDSDSDSEEPIETKTKPKPPAKFETVMEYKWDDDEEHEPLDENIKYLITLNPEDDNENCFEENIFDYQARLTRFQDGGMDKYIDKIELFNKMVDVLACYYF